MTLDDCFEIGYILKPHGLKGAVSVRLDADDTARYNGMESVLVKIGNNLIPFFISSIQIHGQKGIMQLEGINSVDEAQNLKSCPLLLPLDLLPALESNQFYYHDVIGYTILDQNKGSLGIIENVMTGGNQDLIVMKYKKKEVLIPVNNELIGHADHRKKQVHVSLPDGLIEVYLSQE